MSRNRRSIVAQLRLGILPLAIETGRFIGQKPEERLCKHCNLRSIESEAHFVFECNKYDEIRYLWFREITEINPNFANMDIKEKFALLFSKPFVKKSGEYLERFWRIRKKFNRRQREVA